MSRAPGPSGTEPAAFPASLRRFVERLPAVPWFAALGAPVAPSEAAEVRAYLLGLGLPAHPPVPVAGWREAERIARDPGWSRAWWEAEERARAALLDAAHPGAGGPMAALTRVTDAAGPLVMGAAAAAAARAGVADEALLRVAAGAATQACYQAALVLLAGDGDDRHPFAVKFRLFAAGRWPLGPLGGRFFLF